MHCVLVRSHAVHAGTGNVPEGLQEQSLIQLFRDFNAHFSHCQTERVKIFVFFVPLERPRPLLCNQVSLHYQIFFYFLQKIDQVISSGRCSCSVTGGNLSQLLPNLISFSVIIYVLIPKIIFNSCKWKLSCID